MHSKEMIKRAIKTRGSSQYDLAKKMGYTEQSGVGRILNGGGNMRVDKLVEFLDALDYEIVVVDKADGTKLGVINDKYRRRGKTPPRRTKKHLEGENVAPPVETTEPVEKPRVEIPVFQYGK